MYNDFIGKYSDLKRAYVNLIKDSKRIYDENDIMERKYNEMCGLYDEISLKLAKAIIKINRLEAENEDLKNYIKNIYPYLNNKNPWHNL